MNARCLKSSMRKQNEHQDECMKALETEGLAVVENRLMAC
jgi:hypothetical protein